MFELSKVVLSQINLCNVKTETEGSLRAERCRRSRTPSLSPLLRAKNIKRKAERRGTKVISKISRFSSFDYAMLILADKDNYKSFVARKDLFFNQNHSITDNN